MAKYDLKKIYEWPLVTRLLIAFLIGAVVLYLAYRYDLGSLNTDLEGRQSQEKDLKDQLALVFRKQIVLKNELTQYPVLVKTLADWYTQLVPYNKTPEILNEILKIGAANQLFFNLFTPGEEIAENGLIKFPIQVRVVGDYHQIANFFSQVANMPWIVVVNNFTFSTENKNDVLGAQLAEKANTENLLTAEFTLEVYRLPESKS